MSRVPFRIDHPQIAHAFALRKLYASWMALMFRTLFVGTTRKIVGVSPSRSKNTDHQSTDVGKTAITFSRCNEYRGFKLPTR